MSKSHFLLRCTSAVFYFFSFSLASLQRLKALPRSPQRWYAVTWERGSWYGLDPVCSTNMQSWVGLPSEVIPGLESGESWLRQAQAERRIWAFARHCAPLIPISNFATLPLTPLTTLSAFCFLYIYTTSSPVRRPQTLFLHTPSPSQSSAYLCTPQPCFIFWHKLYETGGFMLLDPPVASLCFSSGSAGRMFPLSCYRKTRGLQLCLWAAAAATREQNSLCGQLYSSWDR